MKRLAFVLAAAVLGTGCNPVQDRCTGTVSLQWDFQRPDGSVPTGTVNAVCVAAGVAFVDVFMDGQPVDRFSCSEGGATIVDVRSGQYLMTVEGVDAGDVIRYREEFNLDARSCGDPLIATRPAAGFVDLNYSLPGGVCGASPSYLWFALRDAVTGHLHPESVDAANNPHRYTCPGDVIVSLPAGAYTLEWMEERDTSNGVLGVDCTDRPFDVFGGTTTAQTPAIADSTTACIHPAD